MVIVEKTIGSLVLEAREGDREISLTIEIINLIKSFRGFTLGPINLKLQDNTIMVLIGATGSGKSTLLNLIVGLTKPDSGSISINGVDITNVPIELRRIGYSFQNPSLFPHLNVYENIVFGIRKSIRNNKKSVINRLVESFGVSHLLDRNIHALSGGEMQKISLVRMLVTKPKIMLMDEPLVHLDTKTRVQLRKDLRRILKEEEVLGIYVTHFEDDVYALADSVSVLEKGIIKKTGTLKAMLTFPNNQSLSNSSISEFFQKAHNYLEGCVTNSTKGITTFKVGEHQFEILGDYPVDSIVGVLIKPEDIILAVDSVRTSARNMIKTKIAAIYASNIKTGTLNIHLVINGISLISRITQESKEHLKIVEGDYVYAIFKATAPHIVREEKKGNKIS
ncbi:MAG TPA: ABC transporter ATP-binding protein [Candidatus Nitrosocosmicus sp.]|nr:ABC transporter ATP-binding protein [Candidatus Nitrosocosmicus sp.]